MSSTSYITGSSSHKFSVKNSQAGSNLTKRRVFFSLGVSGNGWRGWCSCWGRTSSWLLPRVLHHLNQLRVLHNTFSVRLMMVMMKDDNADAEEERASNWPLPGVLHRPSHQLYIISTWLTLLKRSTFRVKIKSVMLCNFNSDRALYKNLKKQIVTPQLFSPVSLQMCSQTTRQNRFKFRNGHCIHICKGNSWSVSRTTGEESQLWVIRTQSGLWKGVPLTQKEF